MQEYIFVISPSSLYMMETDPDAVWQLVFKQEKKKSLHKKNESLRSFVIGEKLKTNRQLYKMFCSPNGTIINKSHPRGCDT